MQELWEMAKKGLGSGKLMIVEICESGRSVMQVSM